MKILFIGGTGVISTACTRLAKQRGMDVYVLNRATTQVNLPDGVHVIQADMRQEEKVRAAMGNQTFDVVADFIAFTVEDIERSMRLFSGRTGQFIFISTASAYQTPPVSHWVTESTPLANPHWGYSRNKIACEDRLTREYRDKAFPAVIVRPSLTYGDTLIPLSINSWGQSWSTVDRMLRGKPILVHGDGTGLWTATHNSDFAKAFVGMLGDVRTIGHAFHITSDEVITWNQMYRIVTEIVGAKPNYVHVSSEMLIKHNPELEGWLLGCFAHSVVYDNSKIKSIVPDYVATTTFKQGMQKTIANFRANPVMQKVDEEFDRWCDKVIEHVSK